MLSAQQSCAVKKPWEVSSFEDNPMGMGDRIAKGVVDDEDQDRNQRNRRPPAKAAMKASLKRKYVDMSKQNIASRSWLEPDRL